MSPTVRRSSWSRAGPAPSGGSVTPGRPPSAGRTRGGVDPPGGPGCGLRPGRNAEILTELVTHLRVDVELSGGIRDDDSLERALATGCARVNLGTAALEQPDWCAEVIGLLRRADRGEPGRPRHPAGRPRLDPGGRGPDGDPGPAGPGRLCPLRGHRRQLRRHVVRTEHRPAAPGLRRDRPAGRRQRRDQHPDRRAHAGRDGSARGGRCDHWHRAVRGQLHPGGGPARRPRPRRQRAPRHDHGTGRHLPPQRSGGTAAASPARCRGGCATCWPGRRW